MQAACHWNRLGADIGRARHVRRPGNIGWGGIERPTPLSTIIGMWRGLIPIPTNDALHTRFRWRQSRRMRAQVLILRKIGWAGDVGTTNL